MNFNVKFTPEATQTYYALSDQLRQRWGDNFVEKFAIKIAEALDRIAVSPYMYSFYNEYLGIRKCVLHKNCSMLYRIVDTDVLIICFWDNRQDPIFI